MLVLQVEAGPKVPLRRSYTMSILRMPLVTPTPFGRAPEFTFQLPSPSQFPSNTHLGRQGTWLKYLIPATPREHVDGVIGSWLHSASSSTSGSNSGHLGVNQQMGAHLLSLLWVPSTEAVASFLLPMGSEGWGGGGQRPFWFLNLLKPFSGVSIGSQCSQRCHPVAMA